VKRPAIGLHRDTGVLLHALEERRKPGVGASVVDETEPQALVGRALEHGAHTALEQLWTISKGDDHLDRGLSIRRMAHWPLPASGVAASTARAGPVAEHQRNVHMTGAVAAGQAREE